MNYRNHLIVGAGSGGALAYALPAMHALTDTVVAASIVFIGACIGSFIPDIDHANSKVSQRFWFISWLVRMFCKHRGFTHSCAFLVGLFFLIHFSSREIADYFLLDRDGFYARAIIIFGYGIIAGVMSHIIADSCTIAGTELFYPLSFRFRLPFFACRTGGRFEFIHAGLLVCSFFTAAYFAKAYQVIVLWS